VSAVLFCEVFEQTKLRFEDLFITPVQRVPRYELLIRDLQKQTPGKHTHRERERGAWVVFVCFVCLLSVWFVDCPCCVHFFPIFMLYFSDSAEDDKDWDQLGEAAQVMAKIAGGINTRVMLAKGQTGVIAILERGGVGRYLFNLFLYIYFLLLYIKWVFSFLKKQKKIPLRKKKKKKKPNQTRPNQTKPDQTSSN
jgi:hypothetical protein